MSSQTIYFWRPDEEFGYLGQWFPSPFTEQLDDGTVNTYANAEQYMMHQKGLLFAPDSEPTREIQMTSDPRAIRALGRQIPHFNEKVWNSKRESIVVRGNLLKFSQNEELGQMLLATDGAELVEASPMDRIWGVGFSPQKAAANRSRWGYNLLGKSLTVVRQQLQQGPPPAVTTLQPPPAAA